MSRSTYSNLLAAFCVPGLEEIAEPLYPYISKPKAVSLVGYLVGRTAVGGSAEKLDAELSEYGTWDQIRSVAATFGRYLPEDRPTFDKLHHLRSKLKKKGVYVDVVDAMVGSFTPESFKLVVAAGISTGLSDVDLCLPERGRTVYADGTWFDPFSGVWIDSETGEVMGSRAKYGANARVSTTLKNSKNGASDAGIPIALAGVRSSPERWKRVLLGFKVFEMTGENRDEMSASIALLERIMSVGGGELFNWAVYDMAMVGSHQDKVARMGLVPVAAMPSAARDGEHQIPLEPNAERYNQDQRKKNVKVRRIRPFNHHAANGKWCDHIIWSVDGALRMHAPGENPSGLAPLCPLKTLRFEPDSHGGQRLMGVYGLPCVHAHAKTFEVEFTGKRKGRTFNFNLIRPFHEYVPEFAMMKGWRQDVESANETIKNQLARHGRANSLAIKDFELDLLGALLFNNAICWDVYVAKVTESAHRHLRQVACRHTRQDTFAKAS